MSSMLKAGSFVGVAHSLGTELTGCGKSVPTRRWQAIDVSSNDNMTPIELLNVTIDCPMPDSISEMEMTVEPNMPWAEDHFQERVSRLPLNPPPSHQWWPFARRGNAEHVDDTGKFSHTYPERFWPKLAGMARGIRYELGDLDDVIELMRKDPYTRQAYLPIFFPEDTGAIEGQRIPCTLGYQFLLRPDGDLDKLHLTYHIRSCDFLRHFRDDVYMAMRLAYWVRGQLQKPIHLGNLVMHMDSLHVFEGDRALMNSRYSL